MAPYETLYKRWCRSLVGWFDPREARLSGTDLVCDALNKVNLIHERLHTTQSRQKSYADNKARDAYYGDLSHVLDISTVQLDEDLTYDVEPVSILDRQIQKLRSKKIVSVKVHWRGQPIEENCSCRCKSTYVAREPQKRAGLLVRRNPQMQNFGRRSGPADADEGPQKKK
uniref:Chromo domain-containing protein n=1 Tax=Nicotiana tabacum TaxID=4097 RepID=A0A1S4C008_TOBAC